MSHKGNDAVKITIEIDPTGNGNWMNYKTVSIMSGKKYTEKLPSALQGRWIRFVSDKNVKATAWLEYK